MKNDFASKKKKNTKKSDKKKKNGQRTSKKRKDETFGFVYG